MMKKKTRFIIWGGITLITVGVGYCVFWFIRVSKTIVVSTDVSEVAPNIIFVGGTRGDHENMKKAFQHEEIDEIWQHIYNGGRREKEGHYKEAIEEYKKAIQATSAIGKYVDTQRVARRGLLENYEKIGEYALALEHVEWLIPHCENKDTKKELLEQKERLRRHLEGSKVMKE